MGSLIRPAATVAGGARRRAGPPGTGQAHQRPERPSNPRSRRRLQLKGLGLQAFFGFAWSSRRSASDRPPEIGPASRGKGPERRARALAAWSVVMLPRLPADGAALRHVPPAGGRSRARELTATLPDRRNICKAPASEKTRRLGAPGSLGRSPRSCGVPGRPSKGPESPAGACTWLPSRSAPIKGARRLEVSEATQGRQKNS
jgi:hypothetical protein